MLTPANGLQVVDGDCSQSMIRVPSGGPVYGVYLQEVVPSMSLTLKVIEEIKHARGAVFQSSADRISHADLCINKSDLLSIMEKSFDITHKGNAYKKIVAM